MWRGHGSSVLFLFWCCLFPWCFPLPCFPFPGGSLGCFLLPPRVFSVTAGVFFPSNPMTVFFVPRIGWWRLAVWVLLLGGFGLLVGCSLGQRLLRNANQVACWLVALHKNAFTGHLPTGLDTLEHLGVLTVHENMLVGVIPQLSMTPPCIDNGRYRVSGVSCSLLRSETTCNDPMVQAFGADVFSASDQKLPQMVWRLPKRDRQHDTSQESPVRQHPK